MPDTQLLISYDGSEDAQHAIDRAGALFPSQSALVLTVWSAAALNPSLTWAGMADLQPTFDALRDAAMRAADDGVERAERAGLSARPLVVEAAGPIWHAIVRTADEHDVGVIVMGSRGLSGMKSMLLGSVSSGVVNNAHRPTLVVPPTE
ncbi:MAG TPA: universal stress protein [Solirubrobacteraceae bacterium]|jgi:nucleotide-binding universal stress UspA family protein